MLRHLRQLSKLRQLRKLRIGLSKDYRYLWWVRYCGYWIFLRRLGISVWSGLVDIGLDWDGLIWKYGSLSEKLDFGSLAALWEAFGVSLQRRGCVGLGRYKGRSCSGILDWYFLVDSLGEASGLYRFDPFCSEKLAFNAMAGIMG